MMGRPLMSPDELKTLPKGNFILAKTGCCPMRTQLPLFLKWGIHFEEPYEMPEKQPVQCFMQTGLSWEEEMMLRNGFWEDEEEEDADEECEEDSFWEERPKSPLRDRLKGECSGIFSRNISGGDTAPVCDGIYVSERPDRQGRNLLAGHRNHCARFRPVAQHGKEGTERSGREGIFKKGNPTQGKWGSTSNRYTIL